MKRAHLEFLVLIAAIAHVFVAVNAARSKVDPQAAERIYGVGRAAEEKGEFLEAAIAYEEIYRRHPYAPQAAEAGFRLGRVLCRGFQRFDLAEEVLEAVAEGYPGTTYGDGASKMLQFIREHRADDEAALALFYKSSGALHGKQKDVNEATRLLDEIVNQHPNARIVPTARKQLVELRQQAAGS